MVEHPELSAMDHTERLCFDRAMEQWERSQSRTDLQERDRVVGALLAYQRQAIAAERALAERSGGVKVLSYGMKLIAEAITQHFGERDEYCEDDTTIQDAWEAFDALTRPAEQAVTEVMVEAAVSAFVKTSNAIEGGTVQEERRQAMRAALNAAMEAGR